MREIPGEEMIIVWTQLESNICIQIIMYCKKIQFFDKMTHGKVNKLIQYIHK